MSISAVADYLGLEEEYGKRKFPGERTASIELYPNTQTFYDFGRAVGGDIFDLLSHIKGIGFKEVERTWLQGKAWSISIIRMFSDLGKQRRRGNI